MQDASVVTAQRKKRWLLVVWAALPILAFLAVEIRRIALLVTVTNVDFFGLVERARVVGYLPPAALVDGVYPVGYSLLLKAGLALGLDVIRAGQILSIAGGAFALIGMYLLAWQLTRSHAVGGLSAVTLVTTSVFLFYGSYEGTDMLASGLQVLAVGVLMIAPERPRVTLAAGMLAGLSYLIRYTGLGTFGLCLVYLLVMALVHRGKFIPSTLLFTLGFLVTAAPQWVPSLMQTGQPFYNVQARHVWFKLFAQGDLVTEWRNAPDVSMTQVFGMAPRRFLENWLDNMASFWLRSDFLMLSQPFKLLGQAALILMVIGGTQIARDRRAFLGWFVLGTVAAPALYRLDRRFLLSVIPLLVFGVVYWLWMVIPAWWTWKRIRLPVRIIVWVLLSAMMLDTPLSFAMGSRPDDEVLSVSATLHAAGMHSARQVLSTHVRFHDVESPTRERFVQAWPVHGKMDSFDALRQLTLAKGYRFLVFDRETGSQFYPALDSLLTPENHPAWLTPVMLHPKNKWAVYRVEPDAPTPQSPLDVKLAGGITLRGYDVATGRDALSGKGHIGVYLYWSASQPITQSLKVFVHVLNEAGQLVAQDDSVPALWTSPTDAWQPGQTIIDFHAIPVKPETCTLVAGLYDPDTGARVMTGADDRVVLTKIAINRQGFEVIR